MKLSLYLQSLSDPQPPGGAAPLLTALWYDAHGDWDRAHRITQDAAGRDACAVHAYLHRKEGDLANADYWYQRAGSNRPDSALSTEWRELVEQLAERM